MNTKNLVTLTTSFSIIAILLHLTQNVSAQNAKGDIPLKGDQLVALKNNTNGQIQPDETGTVLLPGVSFGQIQYGGTGCPQGSLSTNFSADKKAISVIFDQYINEAGDQTSLKQNRLDCNMRIPVNVPNGYRLVVAQIDYRGYYFLPAQTRASFYSTHQILDAKLKSLSPKILSTQRFSGEDSNEYYLSASISDKSPKTPMLNQSCGGLVYINAETRTFVQTNTTDEQTLFTLDSLDGQITEGLNFRLQYKTCGAPTL